MKNISLLLLFVIVFGSCTESTNEKELEDIPSDVRFVKEVFVSNLFEPTELVVLPNGDILFTQRRGSIMRYTPSSGEYIKYDSISVHSNFEDGLMGMAIDPDFSINNWVYLYYSPIGDEPVHYLSRFDYTKSGLKNQKIILTIDVQREECCHTGGSIEFGGDGLLYLSTGDDTNPFASQGYAPIDDRPGRSSWDAGRSSANTNDLRGKILRIKPTPNGSYSIPEGNLFQDDDPLTRPEIYVMGCRNPYRIAVDSKRDWLFWGDVGPDALENNPTKGPRGHDEFNVALVAGNFGWPYFVGDNKAYKNYSFVLDSSTFSFDPNKPINVSVNNTGIKKLPPAIPAKIFYPYANSPEFSQVKNGGRNAMAGPVYYSDEYQGVNKFPSFFDGRVFFFDWIRGFVFSLGLDDNGNPVDWFPFMPNETFNNMIDMTFGPDGQLYTLEYGTGWFTRNKDAKLSRIKYTSGNLPPVLEASLSQTNGLAPLIVTLDASKSFDYDAGDELFFQWQIDNQKLSESKIEFTFEEEGVYYPEIIIRDQAGNKVKKQFLVEVGNNAPKLSLEIEGNNSFYWQGRDISYKVDVFDIEDGKLGSGIELSHVDFDITYHQTLDKADVLGHQKPVSSGLTLIESLDCKGCHKIEGTSIGPSYIEVAKKYSNSTNVLTYLSNKIINGGGGVWGEQAMAAHPELSNSDAESIVNYILSLTKKNIYPLKGVYSISNTEGQYVFYASYTDKGKKPLKPIKVTSILQLRSNLIEASNFDYSKNVNVREGRDGSTQIVNIYNQSYVGYRDMDLTGIDKIVANASGIRKNGAISVRINSVDGIEVGRLNFYKNLKTDKLFTSISSTNMGDIYFVFLNPEEENRLINIRSFEFIPSER